MNTAIKTVSTEVMKYNPQFDRFECNLSDLGWNPVPSTFLLFNPSSGIKETLTLRFSHYGDNQRLESWRYESQRYRAIIKNI